MSKKEPKAKKQGLPKQIFVKWENDPNDEDGGYLVAASDTDSMEHGDRVGIYELVETKVKRVTHDLA